MKPKTRETQIAIIGGGIAGTAIARELSKYKVDACLLEKQSSVGWGITKGSMSLVHGGIAYLSSRIVKRVDSEMSLEAFLKEPMNIKERLGEEGREMFFELSPLLNAPIKQVGRVMVAEDREQLDIYKVVKEIAEANGIDGVKILDRDGLKEKEPLINSKFIGGIYDPSEIAIFAPAWALAFAENARNNGIDVLLKTEVKSIKYKMGRYLIKTNNGQIEAEYVVNAAGIFADEVARMIGQDDFSMVFYKCQMLILENRDYIRHVVARLPEPGRPRMLIPTTYGDVLVSHSMDPCTDKNDLSTTSEALKLISEIPPDLIPNISVSSDIKTAFVGQLAFNSKNLPDYLLEFPKPKFLNVALAAPGLGPAPALAQEVVKMLADNGLQPETKSEFKPYHQAQPQFISLSTEEKNRKIKENPKFGHIICRCEHVAEQEIIDAVTGGSRMLDDIKFRTRCGMGRCQGGFCTSRVLQVMARELNVSPLGLTKKGDGSYLLACETKTLHQQEDK